VRTTSPPHSTLVRPFSGPRLRGVRLCVRVCACVCLCVCTSRHLRPRSSARHFVPGGHWKNITTQVPVRFRFGPRNIDSHHNNYYITYTYEFQHPRYVIIRLIYPNNQKLINNTQLGSYEISSTSVTVAWTAAIYTYLRESRTNKVSDKIYRHDKFVLSLYNIYIDKDAYILEEGII